MEYFDKKHLIIRLILMVGVPIITFFILLLCFSHPETYEPRRGMGVGFGAMLIAGIEVMLIGSYIVVETVYLQIAKKYPKRNSNLIVVGIFILLQIIFKTNFF